MQKRIVSFASPFVVGTIALALGWFAHAAVPLAAQGVVVQAAPPSDPAAPAVPAGITARLTYQGRLTNGSGTPINATVNVVFKLYDSSSVLLWTSATRSITPANGLFTVYLGDGTDPNLTSGVLESAVSIGVTVGGDAEMTPRQALNTVVGHSYNTAGVVGSSYAGFGAYGTSVLGVGAYGNSVSSIGVVGNSTSAPGVLGSTGVATRAGVVAQGAVPLGIALRIDSGGIQVTGAGIGTNTPVSTVRVVTGTVGNNVNPFICAGNCVVIDNPLTNGRPDAIVIVTLNFSPAGVSNGIYDEHPISVWYDTVGGRNTWEIIHLDGSLMLNGAAYNVLVVNP